MAPWDSKDDSARDHEHDLGTMLTAEERVELTLLVANISEVMQKQITDTFDASYTMGNAPQAALKAGDGNPNVDRSSATGSSDEDEEFKEMREKREKELSAPKMLELKKEAVKFFQQWQESVISRIGTAVNNPKEVTEEQKKKASTESTPATSQDTKVVSRYPHA
ncbi:duf726 domain-containing protein [Rutstroemia sp. NJR-2017a BVV2]|nr:duf726 domain-containing protein [Rutstroemia sp. NJR-2017a BVV2]